MKWAIITGEYPPQAGGVSDYTRALSEALAAVGDEVHVWAPGASSAEQHSEVIVHRLPGRLGISSLRRLGRELDALPTPYRILVQYVPQAFGWKAMNVPFCVWLWSRRRTPVLVMFHEIVVALDRSQPLRHNVLGLVTRLMAALVTRSAKEIFVSTPAWARFTRTFWCGGRTAIWLPVPSTIGEDVDVSQAQSVRRRLTGSQETLIGHFGTYGPYSREVLRAVVSALLTRDEHRRVLLLGRGSQLFAHDFATLDAALRDRIIVLDDLPVEEVRLHVAACDLVFQPYKDGITTRRTSSMAALALGIPVVTNMGRLSEPLWRELGGVALAQDASPEAFIHTIEELLRCPKKKAEQARKGASLYASQFAIRNTIQALRGISQ